MRSTIVRMILVAALGLAGCAAGGKQPTTQPSTARERQNQALRDPFHYSPEVGDVSGGDVGHFDKDGFNRDMKSLFNP